jgi:hypothetical protein
MPGLVPTTLEKGYEKDRGPRGIVRSLHKLLERLDVQYLPVSLPNRRCGNIDAYEVPGLNARFTTTPLLAGLPNLIAEKLLA